ncbi:MAG: hypothetical protein R3B89_13220 [Polyangiaceae bacterium]
MISPYIRIDSIAGETHVVVDDWEVFDFLDDHLSALGFDFDWFKESMNGRKRYVMRFGKEIGRDSLEQALATIPDGEIERIWSINH